MGLEKVGMPAAVKWDTLLSRKWRAQNKEHQREYMKFYMRYYRAKKAREGLIEAGAQPDDVRCRKYLTKMQDTQREIGACIARWERERRERKTRDRVHV